MAVHLFICKLLKEHQQTKGRIAKEGCLEHCLAKKKDESMNLKCRNLENIRNV